MVLELQGTKRMSDMLQGVVDGMGKVIHGVDAPCISSPVVVFMLDPVDDRVPQIHIARGHVDLGPQGVAAIGEFPGPHPAEKIQTLGLGPVPPGTFGSRLGQAAPRLPDFFGRLFTDKGQAFLDQALCLEVDFFEKIGSVKETVIPIVAQPVDVILDGLDKDFIFLDRVGVVHAEVAEAAQDFCRTKIYDDSLGVADVQIAVGLGWKTGVGH